MATRSPEIQRAEAQINANPAIQRWLGTPFSPSFPLKNVLDAQGIQIPSGYEATLDNGKVTLTPSRHELRNGLLAGAGLLGAGAVASGLLGAAGTSGAATTLGGEASTTLGETGGLIPGLSTAQTIAATTAPAVSTIKKIGGLLGDASKSVGAATTAAGQNRLDANAAAAAAAHQNVVDKAAQEAAQRNQRQSDVSTIYKYGVAASPTFSPNNPRPLTLDPSLLAGLSPLEQEAIKRLQTPSPAYVPYIPKGPSTMEQVGNYTSPILSTIGTIAKYL